MFSKLIDQISASPIDQLFPSPSTDQLFVPQYPDQETEEDRIMKLLGPKIAKIIDMKTATFQGQIDLLTEQLQASNSRIEGMKKELEICHNLIDTCRSDLTKKILGREEFHNSTVDGVKKELDEIRDHLRDQNSDSLSSSVAKNEVIVKELRDCVMGFRKDIQLCSERIDKVEEDLEDNYHSFQREIETRRQLVESEFQRNEKKMDDFKDNLSAIDNAFEDLQILVNDFVLKNETLEQNY